MSQGGYEKSVTLSLTLTCNTPKNEKRTGSSMQSKYLP